MAQCPALIGRERELAELGNLLGQARAGCGTWITVLGEAGIGKTRLVAELRRLALEAGTDVVEGRASSVDTASPFRPLAEILLAATRDVARPEGDSLVPTVAALERFLPHWQVRADAAPVESPAIIGNAIISLLSWIARDGALVVVLEDLHWADADTVAVCDYLIDHLEDTSLLIVATCRTGAIPPPVRALIARATRLELGPLDERSVVAMATACLGDVPDRDSTLRLLNSTGGLPLLIEDLIYGQSRFDDLVRLKFDALSTNGKRAVMAAAVVGERFDYHTVAAALAGDAATSAAALHEATSAQLIVAVVGGFAFRHALTREALLASAPALADSLAGACAQALEASERPEHLARAGELWLRAGDLACAGSAFSRAAAHARANGAPAAALELVRRAVGAAPDEGARCALQAVELELLVEHGQVGAALDLGARLLDMTAAPRSIHRLLARAHLDAGHPERAIEQLEGCDDDAEALVLRARATLASTQSDRRIVAEHYAHQAVAAAERDGEPAVACEALDVAARCARTRSLDDAATALERGLAIAESAGLPGTRLRLLNELGTVEMLRRADGRRLLRARRYAMETGALDVVIGIDVNIAALHAMRNELDSARLIAAQAAADAERIGLTPLAAAGHLMHAVSDGFEGRRAEMSRRLQLAERLVPDDADLHAFAWGAGRGICALVREERDFALQAFRRAIRPDPPVGSLDTARGPLVVLLAATGSATEADLDEARRAATPGAGWSELWVGFGEAALHRDLDAFAVAEVGARRHPLFRAIGLRLLAEAAIRDGWGHTLTASRNLSVRANACAYQNEHGRNAPSPPGRPSRPGG